MSRIPPRERGAALLTVLILVAITGAIAATAVEKLRLSTALSVNGRALDQARAYAIGVETLLTLTIDDLIALSPGKTTLAGGWNGATRTIPLPGGGLAEARVRDGGNCFNVNSVAQGSLVTELQSRPRGIEQFAGLMRTLEVPERDAVRIAQSAGDWVDADSTPNPGGAEDGDYAGGATPHRTGNTLFAEISELRAVAGMTPEIYARVRPWLCALPTTDLSALNVNTLSPDQAPLLAMLGPQRIALSGAASLIAGRPVSGWGSADDFWRAAGPLALDLPFDVLAQVQPKTIWFALDLRIALDGAELYQTGLVDARIQPARMVVRRWGSED